MVLLVFGYKNMHFYLNLICIAPKAATSHFNVRGDMVFC